MKIYTRTGDAGNTALFGGERVSKAHPRVTAYGTVDELNAVLGLARTAMQGERLDAQVAEVQARLFELGADLATPPDSTAAARVTRTSPDWAAALERGIDEMDAELPPLDTFVLPGGTPAAALLHLARTVCRRGEREVVAAIGSGQSISPDVAVYLNRLSDWLFTAARLANQRGGVPDVPWRGHD